METEWINRIIEAHSEDEMYQQAQEILLSWGFEKHYWIVHHKGGTHRPFDTRPKEWMRHYQAQGYITPDPISMRLIKGSAPFFWSEVSYGLTAEQERMMEDAKKFGLKYGFLATNRGPNNEILALGLYDDKECFESRVEQVKLKILMLVSTMTTYCLSKGIVDNPNPELTPRQHECLSLAARGKSNTEIAQILNISASTVKEHFNSISKKLNIYGKPNLISYAATIGLIVY